MVEHGDKIDEFGTPRAFEIIPYWTGLPTMEGTLMEASYTAPFHFINQAELSVQASNAIIGVNYPSLNVPQGITHLQLMNIPYLLTFSPEVTGEVQADPRAELLATFGDYNVFRISGTSGYVEVMKNKPVRLDVEVGEWRDLAVDWYLTDAVLDTPLVLDNGEGALQQFDAITPGEAMAPPMEPIVTEGRVTGESMENESLSFDTTAIGQPHWVKVSYFPNWHVEGAEGPYLASPSFMMVIPTQSHVTLTYGRTTANTVGQVLEVAAWLLLLGLAGWRVVLWRRRRRLAGAVQGSGPLVGVDSDQVGGSRDAPSDGGGDDSDERLPELAVYRALQSSRDAGLAGHPGLAHTAAVPVETVFTLHEFLAHRLEVCGAGTLVTALPADGAHRAATRADPARAPREEEAVGEGIGVSPRAGRDSRADHHRAESDSLASLRYETSG